MRHFLCCLQELSSRSFRQLSIQVTPIRQQSDFVTEFKDRRWASNRITLENLTELYEIVLNRKWRVAFFFFFKGLFTFCFLIFFVCFVLFYFVLFCFAFFLFCFVFCLFYLLFVCFFNFQTIVTIFVLHFRNIYLLNSLLISWCKRVTITQGKCYNG